MTHTTQTRRHLCGMQTVWTDAPEPAEAVALVAGHLDPAEIGYVLLFFAPGYDASVLADALRYHLPDTGMAGCSTSGGICPAGAIDHGLVLVAFPRCGFCVVSGVLADIDRIEVEEAASTVRAMQRRLDRQMPGGAPRHRFALSLIDALSNAEERVVSAVAWALDGTPLVGGSAGDDLAFHRTKLLHDGEIHTNAAIVIVIETEFPVRPFKMDNFVPTDRKFVVTSADEERRRVHELNAEPAAREYAMAVGLDPETLSPMSFAAYPLAVKIGGEYFCRSISRLNEDGSLSFFCAIREGAVLTLAEPRDIVESTRDGLARLDEALGGLDVVIGFDCVLRRLDAESRQVRHQVSELYRTFSVAGFETYGEQYRSMHLNQTFTGIAIGRAGRS